MFWLRQSLSNQFIWKNALYTFIYFNLTGLTHVTLRRNEFQSRWINLTNTQNNQCNPWFYPQLGCFEDLKYKTCRNATSHIPCMLFSLSIQVQAFPRAALEHNSAAKGDQPSEKLCRSLCSPYRTTLTDLPWTALRTHEGRCAHYGRVLINIFSTFCGVQRLWPNCLSKSLRQTESLHVLAIN